MKKTLTYIMLIVAMAMTCGCERRDLYENHGGNLFVDIAIKPVMINDEMRSETPMGMTGTFFDPLTDKEYYTAMLSPTGGFVSINPSTYNLLVYNYDTEFTVVADEETHGKTWAHTNEVPPPVRRSFEQLMKALAAARAENSRGYANDPIIQAPDHLFVGHLEGVEVPASYSEDDVRHVSVEAESIVEVYDYNISRINGLQYVQSAELFISGQVQARRLHDGEYLGVPCTIYSPLIAPRADDFFGGSFRTFGRYPDEPVFLVLRIVNTEDRVSTWEWDVTDQFDSGSHFIEVHAEINVPKPANSGGLAPEVGNWGEIITNIEL